MYIYGDGSGGPTLDSNECHTVCVCVYVWEGGEIYNVNGQKHFIHCQFQLVTGCSVIHIEQGWEKKTRFYFLSSFSYIFLLFFHFPLLHVTSLCRTRLLLFLDVAIFWKVTKLTLAVIAHSSFFFLSSGVYEANIGRKKQKRKRDIEEFSLSYKKGPKQHTHTKNNSEEHECGVFLIFSLFFPLSAVVLYILQKTTRSKTEK